MSQFPIILIPHSIGQVKSAQPPVDLFTESPPHQPRSQPKKLNTALIGIEAVLAVPLAAIISQITSIPIPLIFLVAVGAIAFQSWYLIATYPERREEYKRQVDEYSEKLEYYEQKKHQHEQKAQAARSPQGIAEFRYKLLLDVLRRTIPHDGDESNAPENPVETQFANHLKRYFPSKIHKRLTLKIPNFEHPYTPDIAYIDLALNLYVYIEVDEPYVYHTGKPTHFVDAWKDNKRNNFFTNKGWIVIRFSEEQVICYPQSCCKTIAQVIAQITGDNSLLNQFANTPELQQQRQWTEQEAVEMAANRKRDNYQCQNSRFHHNSSDSLASLIEIEQHVSQPLPPNIRVQRRRVAQARHRTPDLSTSLSPKNTTSHPLSSLANCPYCGVEVRTTKLQSHKTDKCPKKPSL